MSCNQLDFLEYFSRISCSCFSKWLVSLNADSGTGCSKPSLSQKPWRTTQGKPCPSLAGSCGLSSDQASRGFIPCPFCILFNHRSFQKPAVFAGFLEVFWKEGSLKRMGKVPLESWSKKGLKGKRHVVWQGRPFVFAGAQGVMALRRLGSANLHSGPRRVGRVEDDHPAKQAQQDATNALGQPGKWIFRPA